MNSESRSRAARRIAIYLHRQDRMQIQYHKGYYEKKTYNRISLILKEEEERREEFTSMDQVRGKFFPKDHADMKTTIDSIVGSMKRFLKSTYRAFPYDNVRKWIKELEEVTPTKQGEDYEPENYKK